MFYNQILQNTGRKRMLAVLIDPDKHTDESLLALARLISETPPDLVLLGGSIVSKSINHTIASLRKEMQVPVFLFPGNLLQLCDSADGILLLSLISGRNPEYLIGNHVLAAPFLKQSGMEVIPTGYILIESGTRTSVEYISNTTPIPADKTDIAVSTAMAGEMLGLKLIYLEGGSGADVPVKTHLIKEVKKNISIPLMVGGGIRTPLQAQEAYAAGADLVVVGNILEENPELLREFVKVTATNTD